MAAIDLRYARALAQVAQEQGLSGDAVQAQLNDFVELLEESFDLREALANPSISESQKLRVLDALGAKLGFGKAVRNFIAVVMHHQRLHELKSMIVAYVALADEDTGIAEAEIVSAHPLDEANRKLLEAQVAKITGLKVHATYSEDASLLGGAVVRVGSTVYDGSIRAQLEQLRQRMVGAGA